MKKNWIKKAAWTLFVALFLSVSLWIILSNHAMKQTANDIHDRLFQKPDTLQAAPVDTLFSACPKPVQRYLRYALNGKSVRIWMAELKHAAYVETNLDSNFYKNQDWKYLVAEQRVRLDRPAYFWRAMIHLGWEIWLKGWQVQAPSQSELLWTWMGAVPLMKREEPQMRIDGLGRFLIQMPWYPQAMAPSDYLRWEALTDTSARAVITDHGVEVSGVFHFDAEGKAVRLITNSMSRITRSGFIREPRRVEYVQYGRRAGYRIPGRIFFFWKTPAGWLSQADFRLSEIVYRRH